MRLPPLARRSSACCRACSTWGACFCCWGSVCPPTLPCAACPLLEHAACTPGRPCLPAPPARSIALACPGQPGCLVASANCAAPGPLELHLHDAARSAAGQALARGQPLQASLRDGSEAAAAAAAWTDVAQMLGDAAAAEGAITHLLCLPFGCGASSNASSSSSASAPSGSCCVQHGPVGSGTGALLLGCAAPPRLDAQRKAALGALLRCLPAAMVRLSGDTLAFVSYVCGTSGACCCCDDDERPGRLGVEEGCLPGSTCGGRGDDAGTPSTLSPPQSDAGSETDATDAGASTSRSDATLAQARRPSTAAAGGAAAAWPAGAASGAAAAPPASCAPGHGFCKALLAQVAAEPAALQPRSRLCMRFCSERAERKYWAWLAPLQLRTDRISGLLIIAAMVIVALRQVRPWVGSCGHERAVRWGSVGAPCACARVHPAHARPALALPTSHAPLPLPPAPATAIRAVLHIPRDPGPGRRHGGPARLHRPQPGAVHGCGTGASSRRVLQLPGRPLRCLRAASGRFL